MLNNFGPVECWFINKQIEHFEIRISKFTRLKLLFSFEPCKILDSDTGLLSDTERVDIQFKLIDNRSSEVLGWNLCVT